MKRLFTIHHHSGCAWRRVGSVTETLEKRRRRGDYHKCDADVRHEFAWAHRRRTTVLIRNQANQKSEGLTKPNVKVSSPVVVEEYGDYQCPPCGQLYPDLKQIEKEYGDQIQIVFHHFPLMKIHKNALLAAHAAEAARNQKKFWEMHDLLYRNQKEWSDLADPRPVFMTYAKQLGLNIDSFNRDLESNQIDQKITADIQRGTAQGVTGTPTVFLDTHLLRYEATNLDGLRRGINILLERKAEPP